ncbi:MAG: hypothetical protein AAFY60_03515, partial [Myxococcota bacterium]
MIRSSLLLALALSVAVPAQAKVERFSKTVGSTSVGSPPSPGTIEVPFILWGGDFAGFHANGGLTTKSGSLF